MGKKGILVILTGASSVGKSKIRDLLMQDKDLKLFYSISMTTRKQRANEEDGKDYYFVDFKAFAEALKNHELLEFTEFDGYYYGTPKEQVDFLLSTGKNVLVEVEAQGVGQIKLQYPDSIAFFVKPRTMEELKEQILERYKDNDASAARRISKASVEMDLEPLFKHVVDNSDPEKAKTEIKKVILEKMTNK
ncbi:guanylate kinase [Breznakia sp. PF5-3]|uniref:guanylate kinase n=1 Tax=unclassified Breznakia TaxID=2623764 RepID=UPI002404FA83|nr:MULTISPECIES: guanylate kinase [unclassified Breznakia]MDF9824596.1 guanylate kinase [Breznakia sp. PM6-1]MDF9835486.1 guanylate kinase [Breznakia sp. PF5-3]MDF9837896.1 guanylate kinase [Breznakia sp. PFB2-8]MDF9859811.1 guanylate kinase [Breznakia sp. PH5-24]